MKFLKELCFRLGFRYSQYLLIEKAVLNHEISFNMNYPRTDRKMISGNLLGTMFTGHPFTTLGNTLRMIYYTKYIFSKCNISEKTYLHWHAGDDVVGYGT